MVHYFKTSYVRSVYSGYLQGLTYEEIMDKLKLEGKSVSEELIDEIITDCNTVLI